MFNYTRSNGKQSKHFIVHYMVYVEKYITVKNPYSNHSFSYKIFLMVS